MKLKTGLIFGLLLVAAATAKKEAESVIEEDDDEIIEAGEGSYEEPRDDKADGEEVTFQEYISHRVSWFATLKAWGNGPSTYDYSLTQYYDKILGRSTVRSRLNVS